ncbi:MAG: hypothetical protein NNA23_13480 [Nitrospira sp.]|nr:hypothetical protein [Nitrospira sp.]
MRKRFCHSRSFLAATMAVFLLTFSFNAYACLLPLPGLTDASMANGCSTPVEQPVRQVCDAFKTLGVESLSQSAFWHKDHHWSADHIVPVLPTVSHQLERILHSPHSLESSSPPHHSLASTVLRI